MIGMPSPEIVPPPTRALHRHLGIAALVLGIIFAALTLSPGYVGGAGAYWQTPVGDAAKGEIGWYYYARDDWRFPLFAIGNYHQPELGSIVQSDALPILALPMKLIYRVAWPIGSEPPIYTGFWVALCLVLQAVCASRVLRALGIVDPASHVAGIALFCYLPMLMLRSGHTSLMAQFLILIALEGYVRAKRHEGLSRRQWIEQCALPVVALLVHPYLAAMSGVLVAATVLDQWRERRIGPRGVMLRFAAMAIAGAVVMTVGGFFAAAGRDLGDYGLYSMNLMSPWVPFADTLAGKLLHTRVPSIAGLYQWEGGIYLGAGIFMLIVAVSPGLRNVGPTLHRHSVLATTIAVLLAFAISNRVGFGDRELLRVPLPDALLHAFSQLRGSGRFAWVAVYTLLAALVAAICSRYPHRARVILIVAAVLQFIDVWPMQAGVRAASASSRAPTIARDEWTRLIAAHERVFQYPSFECGGVYGDDVPGNRFRELEWDWIAARLNKPTNSAYLARETKDCTREREAAAREHGRPGVLYIYRSTADVGDLLARAAVDVSRCGYLDDVVVCSGDRDLSALR